ncbi:MAG: HlyD family efflux transporter periplasmic adaptor subunit [Nonomuraea sp.]|nr:HlyD family efflux transporter periplasmic adaptor subunit [Nonomuraea sp.]
MTNGALGVLLLGGVALAYAQLGTGGTASQASVRTVNATRATVVAAVSASGAVESARSRSLNFSTSGTVEKIYVKAGDKVSKGDLLAKLDDDAARESLTAAQASYSSAQDDGTSTAQLYAAYVKARNSYRDAERAVEATVLRAPFGGTVTAVNGSVGGSSSGASSSSSSGGSGQQSASTGFIDVSDTRKLQLVGTFTESDVARLKVGQSAAVTFDALPGVEATGKVTQIDPTASTSNNVVQYPVTITFAKVPAAVRLGQTATVEVETGRAENVIAVPSTAVSTTGGQNTVTLLRNGQQVRTQVQVGVKGTSLTEITSGVQEGDQLVPPATTSNSGNGLRGIFGGGGPAPVGPGGGGGR